ncbi:MAG: ABC transporter substrate-binding protein [Myxococcales bacterium]
MRHSKRNGGLTRRDFLKGSAVAGLVAGLPTGWAGGAWADEGPEQKEVRLGIVAVSSCAPIVVAHEKGFFKKHGLTSSIAKESSWATARDKLVSGENHGSHMKLAQPIGATMGLLGSPKTPMLAPYTLSRNGSVFMVSKKLEGVLTADPKTWKKFADELKAKGEVLTIALPLPFGWHSLMWRHFLANAGINADKELKLITLPPAQMVQNLRVGTMHACAMVEPWGTRGVSEKVTSIVFYGHELWPDHPTKAFSVMETFAEKNPRTVRAMLRAVHEAAAWCDDFGNRPELAKLLAVPSYLNSPEAAVRPALMGELDWGDGRKATDKAHAISYSRGTTTEARELKWFVSQFRRWGMCEGEPDYDGLAKRIARAELYQGALKDLGVAAPAPNDAPIKLWDGTVFDHKKAAEFAKSAPINNLKG